MNKKFKLDLNKEVISNLQAKQVTGGGGTHHETSICNIRSAQVECGIDLSFDHECTWSEGFDDIHRR